MRFEGLKNQKKARDDSMGKQKVTMTIDGDTFLAFKRICKANAMKVSSKVELMMQEFINAVAAEEARAPKHDSPVRHSIPASTKHHSGTKTKRGVRGRKP
ncbi:hypothetical protein D6783_01825 [Candidatus Woesearchaeota archaeon]|nr:MAG: hypothetical protein D6783_01825 [Candidatus Woesearchaeota archaeon]